MTRFSFKDKHTDSHTDLIVKVSHLETCVEYGWALGRPWSNDEYELFKAIMSTADEWRRIQAKIETFRIVNDIPF